MTPLCKMIQSYAVDIYQKLRFLSKKVSQATAFLILWRFVKSQDIRADTQFFR